ncbi:MAG: prephenate dehydratase [Caulobacterales bacterium]|nr:prephenate dehydratase [Caulobacterales bacterium]
MTGVIAFQGERGAFSEQACREAYPDLATLPCATFEDAFAAVENGEASLGMIAVENSVAGRVADIHHLLPTSPLYIVGEHFSPVRQQLLAPKGTALADITHVRSHPMALAQCRRFIAKRGLTAVRDLDTAGSARAVAENGAPGEAAIASELAGEVNGLDVIAGDIQDDHGNTTRFLVMAREATRPKRDDSLFITSFLFRVRNVSAALYKGLGGFATNGVNMTKLESYQLDGRFTATQFYADVEGHPEDPNLAAALDELQYFSSRLRVLGVYRAHPFRFGDGLSA